MLPSYPDISTTPLQEATLQAVEALIKVSHSFPHYAIARLPRPPDKCVIGNNFSYFSTKTYVHTGKCICRFVGIYA